MKELLVSSRTADSTVRTFDRKGRNVIKTQLLISVGTQSSSSNPNNGDQPNVNDGKVSPTRNAHQLELRGENFVKSKRYVLYYITRNLSSQREHSMCKSLSGVRGKNWQAHETRGEGGKPQWFEAKHIQPARLEERLVSFGEAELPNGPATLLKATKEGADGLPSSGGPLIHLFANIHGTSTHFK